MTHKKAVECLDAIENVLNRERMSGRDRYSDFAIVLEALYFILLDKVKETDTEKEKA